MTNGMVSFVGVSHPWMCDEFGHMNRRFYAHMLDDAAFCVMRYFEAADADSNLGWADVRTETDYKSEIKPGSVIKITSSVTRTGNKSLTVQHVMTDYEESIVYAVEICISARFDLEKRAACPLSSGVVERANSISPARDLAVSDDG